MKAKIDKKVKHQGIGGEIITLEKMITVGDILDTNFDDMTIAMFNFAKRRIDLMEDNKDDVYVYYGHVDGLGYYVAEDEISILGDSNG